MEIFDISKASYAVARKREGGDAVCLYIGFDIGKAIVAAEKADPAKFDQVIVLRKPPTFKRRAIQAPEPAQTPEPLKALEPAK